MKQSARALAVLLCCVMALVSVAYAAGTYTKTITAYYDNIKLSINGTIVTPKDVKGNVVDPFTNSGTTYLPVRAVSEALGKKVDWDAKTKTVIITDQAPGYLGTWKAVKASSSGIDTPVADVFPKGYVVRLAAGGKGTTDIAGETYDITWKESNGALTIIYSDSYNWYGTITDNVMVLNIEGTFVTLTK